MRNAIALVSNARRGEATGPVIEEVAGLECPTKGIAKSGMWYMDYVTSLYDVRFLEMLGATTQLWIGVGELARGDAVRNRA